jgi:hypothetical protein
MQEYYNPAIQTMILVDVSTSLQTYLIIVATNQYNPNPFVTYIPLVKFIVHLHICLEVSACFNAWGAIYIHI